LARESSQNLGYGWYRKTAIRRSRSGVRQAEGEEDPEFYHTTSRSTVRARHVQRMPVFLT